MTGNSAEDPQRQRLWPAVVAIVAIAGVVGAVFYFGQPLLPLFSDPVTARATISGLGMWGPLVFMLMQVVQVVIAPLPGQVSGIVGGFLFGPWLGLLYTMIGAFFGFWLVFVLARRLGRPFVERFVKQETLTKFDSLLAERGAFVLFMIYLLPAFPDDVISFVAGLTRIPIRTLLIVSVAGRLPGYVVLSFAGEGLTGENMNPIVVGGAVLLTLAIIAAWKRRWIHDLVDTEDRRQFLRDSWTLSLRWTIVLVIGLIALSAMLVWAAFVPPVQ